MHVIDLGNCNVGSVANMIRKVGGIAEVATHPEQLGSVERVILPGVGSFDEAISRLDDRGFRSVLEAVVRRGLPVLGICLGMQLLADRSDEGELAGLGCIPGQVLRLPADGPDGPVKVPHMGWSRLLDRVPHALLDGTDGESRFYFVHSYAFVPAHPDHVLARAVHGAPFVAAIAKGNVAGVQFHPEKSHRHGMQLLKAFLRWQP